MSVIEFNLNPSQRDLKIFGWLLPVFFTFIGGLMLWRFQSMSVAQSLWIVGVVMTLVYWGLPRLQRLVYVGWIYAAYPIGWTVSHIILAIVFYLVITPIGLVMWLVRYDPMQRKLDRQAKSYWSVRKSAADVKQYYRQF